MRHPGVPPPLRGTYAGLAHDAVTGYLRDLGVTTVELLPVHESVPESFLVERGLTNYWGYNTIGYFAPHQAYSAAVRGGQPGGQVAEFKAMVNALHRAGLEVLLDVVFNHTAEGNHLSPTLCFRGLAADGTPLLDGDFLVLVNAWWEAIDFVLPDARPGAGWHAEVDTFSPGALDPGTLAGPAVAGRAGDKLAVGPRSVVVLRSPRPEE